MARDPANWKVCTFRIQDYPMKPLLFILICNLFSSPLFAQKIHFTDIANQWNVQWTNYGPPLQQKSIDYFFEGDTAINSHVYRKMSCPGLAGYSSYPGGLFTFVREDTVLKKVFVLINDSEQVFMDYNLSTGDSILHKNCMNEDYLDSVSEVDSTMINSVYYKVWKFISIPSGGSYYLIEGVGCVQGPLFINYRSGLDGFNLTCFYNNGAKPVASPSVPEDYIYSLFSFDNQASCALGMNPVNKTPNDVTIYPNPATTNLTILSINHRISLITITNPLGQTVYNHTFNATEVQIDVVNLPAGVYFLKINGTEVRKFVKK